MTLTPLGHIHAEAETEYCICDRLRGCGGIPNGGMDINCPEHSGSQAMLVKMHSHPIQARRSA